MMLRNAMHSFITMLKMHSKSKVTIFLPDSRRGSCYQAYGGSAQSTPAQPHTVTPHQAAELIPQPRTSDYVSANPATKQRNYKCIILKT